MSKTLAVVFCLAASSALAYSSGITGRSQQGCGSCHNSTPSPTVTLNGPTTVTAGSSTQYSLVISGGNTGGAGLDVSITGGSLSLTGSDGPNEQTSGGEITNSNTGPGGSTVTYTFHVTAGTGSSMTIYSCGLQGGSRNSSGYNTISSNITIGTISQPPTIATAASANPSSTTGTTSQLSVLGGPAGSESTYTYGWASSPSGVTFNPNNINGAKNTTATFPGAGTYTLTATITNPSSQTAQSSTSVTVNSAGSMPPTITQPATPANSNATGTTVGLSVGAQSNTGTGLTYLWSSTGSGVTFNPANAANTTATFTGAGNYPITVTVTDPSANGGSTPSSTSVTVTQTASAVSVGPQAPSVQSGTSQLFTATAVDQFNASMSAGGAVWSATGDGTIDSSGNFTAGATAGNATVTATVGALSGQTAVTVTPSSNPVVTTGGTSVQWLQPGAGTNLSGTVVLRAAANDPNGIASVSFGADGTNLSTVSVPSYETRWDTSTLKNGSHTLSVTATGMGGTQSVASVTVVIQNTSSTQSGCNATGNGSLFALLALAMLTRRRLQLARNRA